MVVGLVANEARELEISPKTRLGFAVVVVAVVALPGGNEGVF